MNKVSVTCINNVLEMHSLHESHQKTLTKQGDRPENNGQYKLKPEDTNKRINKRAQIDLIEVQVEQANDIKYFFVYEDLISQFVILQALSEGNVHEVALKLLDILAILGVPTVLQSNNGRKFAEQIVHEVRYLWKDLNIFHGDVSETYKSKRDFKNLLQSWLKKNPSKTWYEGLKSIQVDQNSINSINGKSPTEILLGNNVFKKDTIHNIDDIWSEEDLCKRVSIQIGVGDHLLKTDCPKRKSKEQPNKSGEDNEPETNTSRLRHCRQGDNSSFVKVKNEVLSNNGREENHFNMDGNMNDSLEIKKEYVEFETTIELKALDNTKSLKCKFCHKQYVKLGHLKNHMKIHKRGQKFECSLCHETYCTLSSYNTHMEQVHKQVEEVCGKNKKNNQDSENHMPLEENSIIHEQSDESLSDKSCEEDHVPNVQEEQEDTKISRNCQNNTKKNGSAVKGNGDLECTYCKQKFNFPSVLKRHMRSHTNERPYVCDICQKSFKQLGHLSQHSLTHRDYRSFRCMVCGVKFEALNDLKTHFQTHKGDKIALKSKDIYRLFECDNCKKVFTTKSVLERHIFTHTHERQFGCKVCGKRFKQAGHVKSHMLIHTGERKFECTVCTKRFSLSNSLKKHMYVHNGEKPYQCDMCGARFLERRNLNGHLMTHTNERPFSCKICGKRYTLADTLRRHVSAAHEDGRTYQCEICAKMFKQLAHLSVHKKVHNDERPFQCHLCNKNFKHKNVLKSHLAIHANVRPFECDVCKATFVRKTNLQTHIASAHMNERPYACTICGKRFKQVSHLNGHVVVHSNLMPYQCDFCDRRCNRLDNLKKHMRLHTKNKE